MKYDVYENLLISDESTKFEFVSTGVNGNILKRVEFTQSTLDNVYELSLVDIVDDEFSDSSISNNGDTHKVLATIAKIVELYTSCYPDRWVFFEGNTQARTRLYRRAISLNLAEIVKAFDIYVWTENSVFVPFQKDIAAEVFLVKRKLFLNL